MNNKIVVVAEHDLLNVYTGFEDEHDQSTCSDCKANRPCQYTVEKPFYKLGYSDIKKGDWFNFFYSSNPDYIRLIDKDKIIWSIAKEDFIKSFPNVDLEKIDFE